MVPILNVYEKIFAAVPDARNLAFYNSFKYYLTLSSLALIGYCAYVYEMSPVIILMASTAISLAESSPQIATLATTYAEKVKGLLPTAADVGAAIHKLPPYIFGLLSVGSLMSNLIKPANIHIAPLSYMIYESFTKAYTLQSERKLERFENQKF